MELVNDTMSRYKYFLTINYISEKQLFITFKISNVFGTLYTETISLKGYDKSAMFKQLLTKNTISKININYAESPLDNDEEFYEFASKLDASIFRNSKNTNFLILN